MVQSGYVAVLNNDGFNLDEPRDGPLHTADDAWTTSYVRNGTFGRGRSYFAMGREATPRNALWRMFANAAALLAVVLFLAHGVAAGGILPHAHGPTAAHAELPLVSSDTGEADDGHEHAEAGDSGHHTAGGASACCGDACLSALMPGEGPCLHHAWQEGSKPAALFSLLSGRAPEGLRRPPRLMI